MEQLVILVIIGLISLANWVMQKSAEKREAAKLKRVERGEVKRETRRNIYTQPAPAAPPEARRQTAERDPFKDLMDALGLPADEAPPGTVVAEPAFIGEEEFASLEEPAPPPVPKPAVKIPRWQSPAVPKFDDKTAKLAYAFAAAGDKAVTSYRGTKLSDLLGDRDAQRKAVVLGEILGTPRGLIPSSALLTRGHL
ncbi:MAG: hypothetical protein WEB31_06020 [Chthoniobacterales bacterium]